MNSNSRNRSRSRKLTPDEAEKYRLIRAEIEKEKPELIARLRRIGLPKTEQAEERQEPDAQ
jgi:hypothetical protein